MKAPANPVGALSMHVWPAHGTGPSTWVPTGKVYRRSAQVSSPGRGWVGGPASAGSGAPWPAFIGELSGAALHANTNATANTPAARMRISASAARIQSNHRCGGRAHEHDGERSSYVGGGVAEPRVPLLR